MTYERIIWGLIKSNLKSAFFTNFIDIVYFKVISIVGFYFHSYLYNSAP